MPEEGNGTVLGNVSASGGSTPSEAPSPTNDNPGAAANNQSIGWRAGLPADLKEHPEFQAMPKVGDLAAKYLDTQAKLSKAVVIPGENARADELSAFRSKLGVPDNPEGYEIDATGDPAFAEAFRKTAHEQGLTPAQAKTLYAGLMDASRSLVAKTKEQAESKRNEMKAALKNEWGEKFDSNEAAARRMALVTGSDFTEALTAAGAIDDPRILKGLYRFANMISEDRLVEGRGQRATDSGWQFPNTPGM